MSIEIISIDIFGYIVMNCTYTSYTFSIPCPDPGQVQAGSYWTWYGLGMEKA